jgi:capsular exopolysaccharide synthesis family protein
MAEAFRTIRTGITLSAASKKMKRLLVTSPLPGEGKTVVAVNTAAALAQGGAKVLLVDTDMRRPRVHKVFGVRPKTGLTSYLVSDGEGVRIEDVVTRTGQPNLDVLFCDQVPPNPAELLGSSRMESLIREASERYDRIVFDSPPTAVVADPSILSSKADGVVMVVRAFNTDRHVARRTKETLEGIANRVIGVVVNGVDAARHGAYHGYGYGYGYGRYYGRGKGGDDGGNGDALPHEGDGSLAADRVGAHDGDGNGNGNGNGDAERREESRQFRDLLMMAESDRR